MDRAERGRGRGKIVVLTPGGLEHGGGIGRLVGYLSTAWRDRPGAPPLMVLDSRGGGARFLSPVVLAGTLVRVAALHARGEVALVHVNIAGRGSTLRKLVATAWLRALGLPFVLHQHDYNYARFYAGVPALLKRRIAAMFQAAERVVSLGQADRAFCVTTLGVAPARAIVLHNAVPDPWPSATHGRDPGDAAAREPLILFLGGLGPRKGVPELLDALAAPELRARRWRAVVAGGGPVALYQRRVDELGLADRVQLPGWVDRPTAAGLLDAAQLLALPSHDEGMPIAVLESMAHGLAIVATPVGAVPEVIDHGVSGLLVAPGDRAGLADALCRLLDDPALRAELGSGARRRFLEGFEITAHAGRLEALYHDALRSAAGPAQSAQPLTRQRQGRL